MSGASTSAETVETKKKEELTNEEVTKVEETKEHKKKEKKSSSQKERSMSVDSRVLHQQKKGDYDGFLLKKDPGIVKSWKKRHFRLYIEDEIISYFNNEKDALELASLDCSIEIISNKKQFLFNIKGNESVWNLQAESEEIMNEWIQRLEKLTKGVNKNYQSAEDSNEKAEEDSKAEVVPKKQLKEGDLVITIYANGRIFIQEVRQLELNDGRVTIGDIPSALIPTTVNFRSLTEPTARIIDQTFYSSNQSDSNFLQRFKGKNVTIVTTRPDPKTYQGLLLDVVTSVVDKNVSHRILLREKDRDTYLTSTSISSISVYDSENSPKESTNLEWTIEAKEKKHVAEISYAISSGLNWEFNYVAILDSQEDFLEFNGWLTLNNTLGLSCHDNSYITDRTFQNANLYFLLQTHPHRELSMDSKFSSMRKSKTYDHVSSDTQLLKYSPKHLVTIPRFQSKQIGYVSSKFPIKRMNLLSLCKNSGDHDWNIPEINEKNNSASSDVATKVFQFKNVSATGLGIWLPKGELEVLQREDDGFGLESVTTTTVPRTEPNGTVTIPLGKIEDVNAWKKQISFVVDKSKTSMTESFEISLMNRGQHKGSHDMTFFKSSSVDVAVEDLLWRYHNWKITSSNPSHTVLEDEGKIFWPSISLKPNNMVKLLYTVVYSGFTLPS